MCIRDSALELLQNIRPIFYENLEEYVDQMVECANAASEAISILQVPFLSTLMDGIKTGVDTRDTKTQGTKYNGSGCLIPVSYTHLDVYKRQHLF